MLVGKVSCAPTVKHAAPRMNNYVSRTMDIQGFRAQISICQFTLASR